MSSLTPTARVILGMLKLGVGTGYDIKTDHRRIDAVLLDCELRADLPGAETPAQGGPRHRAPGAAGKVKRTVYELTPKGEKALHEWLTDSEDVLFEIRDESLLRLFFSDMLSKDEVLANVHMQQRIFSSSSAGSARSRWRRARGSPRAASTRTSRCATGSTSSPGRATGTRRSNAGSRPASRYSTRRRRGCRRGNEARGRR